MNNPLEGYTITTVIADNPIICSDCHTTIHVGDVYQTMRPPVRASQKTYNRCKYCLAAGEMTCTNQTYPKPTWMPQE